jgi:hypothetical protein
MRLAAHSRIVGALALAIIAVALVPGTSAAHRLTQQEYARLIQASHQGSASATSAGGSLTQQEIARLAQRSRQDPASVAEAPVLRPNPDLQVPQYLGINRAKEPSDGFDFGDAAVGAGITAAIVLLAAVTVTLTGSSPSTSARIVSSDVLRNEGGRPGAPALRGRCPRACRHANRWRSRFLSTFFHPEFGV